MLWTIPLSTELSPLTGRKLVRPDVPPLGRERLPEREIVDATVRGREGSEEKKEEEEEEEE